MVQTILGSGGAIGTQLAKALKKHTKNIRLVSRDPAAVNKKDELITADLINQAEVAKAVEGSEVVYLTVGLEYNTMVWQTIWPRVMRNTIVACKLHNAKLVFFDNVYMYDPNHIHEMTEETPVFPRAKKGKVRAGLAKMIMDEVEKEELTALIARSADYYGPSIKNTSILTETILNPLSAGKKASWLGSADLKHSFTYTIDAAKATALLGNTEDAYGQIWHLPTAPEPLTIREIVELAAGELGVKPRVQSAPKLLLRFMGLFNPILKETIEMMYQYKNDYIFDSSKFNERFKFKTTSYQDGIKKIIDTDYKAADKK